MKRSSLYSWTVGAILFFAYVEAVFELGSPPEQVVFGTFPKHDSTAEQVTLLFPSDYGISDTISSTLSLEDWIEWQRNHSFRLILENIGGISTTLNQLEVSPGSVIASPSRANPNYFYNWVRDSALTIRSLINELHHRRNGLSKSLEQIIELYIEINFFLQRQTNRSGSFEDKKRSGLGEPKFMSNGDQFSDDWGRPQSDGPALRISTIVEYLNYIETSGGRITNQIIGNASHIYFTCVRPDLEYVLENWRDESFDLWEEVRSTHFYNAVVHLRGLHDGLSLARTMNDNADFIYSLKNNIRELHDFILNYDTGFKSYQIPYVVETPSLLRQGKRIGLDVAALLASLHAHDMTSSKHSSIPFDIDDSHILNTLAYLTADMKLRYPVNHKYSGRDPRFGAGLGRYPEDVYDGYVTSEGNPWFICTASASEVLYRLVYKKITESSNIVISPDNREFYSLFVEEDFMRNQIDGEASVITHGSVRYTQTLENIFVYSDTFMQVIRDHVDNEGHMSEQFSKVTGFMQGAHDLTWSYSTFYNSAEWRVKAKFELEHLTQV